MNKNLFFFLLLAIYSPVLLSADKRECLVCGEEDDVFALCPQERDHTVACKYCCPLLFSTKTCSHCRGRLKSTSKLPKEFQQEITNTAQTTEIFKLEKRIEEEKLIPIKNHHTFLVNSILISFGINIIFSNNKEIINQTKKRIQQREEHHYNWYKVLCAFSYFRAWKELIRDPQKNDADIKIAKILGDIPSYEDQEYIHRIGINPQRITLLHEATLAALTRSEGFLENSAPNLKKIAAIEMDTTETSL